ncbi:MAG: hypothetical protein PHY47_11540 [Lachnospiraceae bacterium]|nr:hypothetical protein [Lachnospiraceae bacterium]
MKDKRAYKNGSKERVSLLQYMKHTTLENPEVIKKDKKLLELDLKASTDKEYQQKLFKEFGI